MLVEEPYNLKKNGSNGLADWLNNTLADGRNYQEIQAFLSAS